jgi:sugar phosphate isomerase/epimerase
MNVTEYLREDTDMRKLSIFSWFGFSIPMNERFKLIKEAGFDGVMLWWSDEYAEADGDKSLHPELARQNGLFIENIHTPFQGINCLWTEGINGDDFEKILLNCIDDCSMHEIPTAVVHSCRGYNPPPINQVGLNRIKRLVETAEKKNVNIALENLRRPDYLDFIFQNIKSDRLGFCYDSGHENCYTKGTDLLTQYGSKLMALHLHDNDGTDDQHLIPGEGSIDWGVIKKKLNEAKYSGTVALEVTNEFSHCAENRNPEVFLRKAYEAAIGLLI